MIKFGDNRLCTECMDQAETAWHVTDKADGCMDAACSWCEKVKVVQGCTVTKKEAGE